MGNSATRPNERFAADTLSYIVSANKSELLALQKRFRKAAAHGKHAEYRISKESFDQACRECNLKPADKDLFARFFVLYDKTGLNEVNYRELLIGVTPIIKGTLEDKVRLALRLCDEDNAQVLSRDDVTLALSTMNRTLDFLGDSKLSDDMIEEVIDSIFDTVKLQDGCIRYLDHLSLFAYHPIVEALLRK